MCIDHVTNTIIVKVAVFKRMSGVIYTVKRPSAVIVQY